MTAITFDTHKFVTKLNHSGIDEKHAEAISDAFRDAQAETEIATKKDIKDLEQRMIIKVGAMLTAAVSFLALLLKVF